MRGGCERAAEPQARPAGERPRVYFATARRYAPDAAEYFEELRAACDERGWELLSPLDPNPSIPAPDSDDELTLAAHDFDRWQQAVRDCDLLVADLSDLHGWEPSPDVSFECGMAYQLGKKLIGHMPDARPAVERVPHLGPDKGYADIAGAGVENFDYAINLMFASSMEVIESDALAAFDHYLADKA